jgi:uncharacterized membrane protein HdeD (DUF308 family)
MTSQTEANPKISVRRWQLGRRRVRGILVLLIGCLAIAAPFFAGSLTFFLGGLLLIVCGVLEMLETIDAPDSSSRCSYLGGELSILAGILLLKVPELTLKAVALLLGVSFLIDGVSKGVSSLRAKMAGSSWTWMLTAGLANVGLGLMLVTRWPVSDWPFVEILVGIRMLTAGWSMLFGREAQANLVETPPEQHPDLRLHLPAHPAFVELNATIKAKEEARRSSDVYWCWIFVIVFFAIHIGRMRVYWNLVGAIAPLFAVAGDLAVALFFAFGFVLPARLAWRKLTRPVERRAWKRTLAQMDQGRSPGLLGRLSQGWLTKRLRFAKRLGRMRRSPREALAWGMKVGLPITAVFIAIQPVFGYSWFFNSESWATIVWDKWAEARTDTWRENMIGALREHYKSMGDDRLFRVEPPGVSGTEDFTFLVLGDTGDGGAAQHSLRDQYLSLGKRPDVKFLVISSDVIYPDGAMRDYEPNFYLPFKGFTKPIYAIPGNHDWYDALEGFAANFLEPDAARTCMVSRVETDRRLTTTNESRIDGYIQEAARLRKEFGVNTGLQRGPIFEVQTDRFALIAVDTGVLKTVDSAQWDWLKAALKRARGKFTMVLLGHPLYTAGRYQGDPDKLTGEWSPPMRSPFAQGGENEPFTAIHRLLHEHRVDVVMAGDMHFFEHYQETYTAEGKSRTMHHFVNGGGGAYMCVGMPFDWPHTPDAPVWTYFPRTDTIIDKLDAQTPVWKMPLWLWVKHYSGWPFSGYIMSAAFDHNKAPFFQSFVEIQVLNSKNEVRFLPHGANGRLRWRELENYRALMPQEKSGDDLAEFIIKMPTR